PRPPDLLLSRNDETRGAHAEGREDALLEDLAERDTFDPRDDEAKQVVRLSVMKTGPPLIDQRQRGESCDPLIRAEGVVDLPSEGVGAGARDRTTMKLAIGEPSAVSQEGAERDRPLHRVRLVQRTIRIAQDAEACELSSMSRDWLVQ